MLSSDSRYLTGLGATVIVANPRKLHAISRHERKCDRRDGVMLARLARADAALLQPKLGVPILLIRCGEGIILWDDFPA